MRRARTFRFRPWAISLLDTLHEQTGETRTELLEQALQAYATRQSASLDDSLLTSASGPYAASGLARELEDNRIELETTDIPSTTSNPKQECTKTPNRSTEVRGKTYTFNFAVSSLPKRPGDPCPCGSGVRFQNCHYEDLVKAREVGVTRWV